MSGGHFSHSEYTLETIADEIQEVIETNKSTRKDCFGYPIGRNYNDDTIAKFKEAVALLRKSKKMVRRIDYLLSGDDGEDSFHSRWWQEIEPKCHVDEKMFDEVYDHCVLDTEMKWDCNYAVENNIKDKKECKFWL